MLSSGKKETSDEKEINNPGAGDCGYYAFVIGLLPHVLQELRIISQFLDLDNIDALVEKDYNATLFFYELSLKKHPILFSLSEKISQGKCRLDGVTKDNKIDITEQKKLFLNWLIKIKKLETNTSDLNKFHSPDDQTKTTLLTGVYLLRTLLANTRNDFIKETIDKIKNELEALEQSEKQSKNNLEQHKKQLGIELNKETIEENDIKSITSEWLIKERREIEEVKKNDKDGKQKSDLEKREEVRKLKNSIFEELQIVNRTIEEKRVRAFENCYKDDITKVNLDSITVLLKHSDLLSSADDTKSATVNNKEINDFAGSFISWWKKNNHNTIPEINTPEFYKLKSTYIACLYGNITFKDRSPSDVTNDTNNWWTNPELKQDSVMTKVANVVKPMGTWAEEIDLKTLASIAKIHLQFEGKRTDANPNKYPIITLKNSGNVHWTTKMPPSTVSQTFPILGKSFFREQDKMRLVAEQLNQELNEFMDLAAGNIEKWKIIYNLREILGYEKNKSDPTKLKDNFFACKEKFEENIKNDKLAYPDEKDPCNAVLKSLKTAFENPDKWITTTYETAKSDSYFTTLSLEDRLQFPKIAEDIARHLYQEFLALKDIKKIKNDPKKLKIVENLITTLNLKGKTPLSHNELIKNITTCKENFQKNFNELDKNLDKAGTDRLHRILYFFCWLFKIRVDAKIYEGAINKINEVANIKLQPEPKTLSFTN